MHLEPSLIADHGQYLPIAPGRSVIGRDDDASLRIADQAVDRRHAELVRVGDGVGIVDLGSGTGTFVNDEPIRCGAAATLCDGDVVRVGRTSLRFVGPVDPARRHTGRSTVSLTNPPGALDSSFTSRDQQAADQHARSRPKAVPLNEGAATAGEPTSSTTAGRTREKILLKRFFSAWKVDLQARLAVLDAELQVVSGHPGGASGGEESQTGREADIQAARTEIDSALRTLDAFPWFPWFPWFAGSRIESAYMHLHSADVRTTRLQDHVHLEARAPYLVSKAKRLLPYPSERLHTIETLFGSATPVALQGMTVTHPSPFTVVVTSAVTQTPSVDGDGAVYRLRFAEALHNLHEIADQRYAQLRRFRNNLRFVGILLTVLIAALIGLGAYRPAVVPLCFSPSGATTAGDVQEACPTSERRAPSDAPNPITSSGASTLDVSVVALLGVVGAALSGALATRKFRPPPRTPYNLPLFAFLLKLPVGALTAIGGLILISGEVVPGLSALDSQGQVLAYALVLGFAQHLFTKYLDDHGARILLGIPEKSAVRTAKTASTDDNEMSDSPQRRR